MIALIDDHLLDAVCAEAAASPRRRKNRNFHRRDDQPGHRLLNAMQRDSYIAPHRHLDPDKDETMVVLRGCMGLVLFDEDGRVLRSEKIMRSGIPRDGVGGAAIGVDIAHGTWHTVVALEDDTVFLEAKAGPYLPLTDAERAPWAPRENEAGAKAFLAGLRGLFA